MRGNYWNHLCSYYITAWITHKTSLLLVRETEMLFCELLYSTAVCAVLLGSASAWCFGSLFSKQRKLDISAVTTISTSLQYWIVPSVNITVNIQPGCLSQWTSDLCWVESEKYVQLSKLVMLPFKESNWGTNSAVFRFRWQQINCVWEGLHNICSQHAHYEADKETCF